MWTKKDNQVVKAAEHFLTQEQISTLQKNQGQQLQIQNQQAMPIGEQQKNIKIESQNNNNFNIVEYQGGQRNGQEIISQNNSNCRFIQNQQQEIDNKIDEGAKIKNQQNLQLQISSNAGIQLLSQNQGEEKRDKVAQNPQEIKPNIKEKMEQNIKNCRQSEAIKLKEKRKTKQEINSIAHRVLTQENYNQIRTFIEEIKKYSLQDDTHSQIVRDSLNEIAQNFNAQILTHLNQLIVFIPQQLLSQMELGPNIEKFLVETIIDINYILISKFVSYNEEKENQIDENKLKIAFLSLLQKWQPPSFSDLIKIIPSQLNLQSPPELFSDYFKPKFIENALDQISKGVNKIIAKLMDKIQIIQGQNNKLVELQTEFNNYQKQIIKTFTEFSQLNDLIFSKTTPNQKYSSTQISNQYLNQGLMNCSAPIQSKENEGIEIQCLILYRRLIILKDQIQSIIQKWNYQIHEPFDQALELINQECKIENPLEENILQTILIGQIEVELTKLCNIEPISFNIFNYLKSNSKFKIYSSNQNSFLLKNQLDLMYEHFLFNIEVFKSDVYQKLLKSEEFKSILLQLLISKAVEDNKEQIKKEEFIAYLYFILHKIVSPQLLEFQNKLNMTERDHENFINSSFSLPFKLVIDYSQPRIVETNFIYLLVENNLDPISMLFRPACLQEPILINLLNFQKISMLFYSSRGQQKVGIIAHYINYLIETYNERKQVLTILQFQDKLFKFIAKFDNHDVNLEYEIVKQEAIYLKSVRAFQIDIENRKEDDIILTELLDEQDVPSAFGFRKDKRKYVVFLNSNKFQARDFKDFVVVSLQFELRANYFYFINRVNSQNNVNQRCELYTTLKSISNEESDCLWECDQRKYLSKQTLIAQFIEKFQSRKNLDQKQILFSKNQFLDYFDELKEEDKQIILQDYFIDLKKSFYCRVKNSQFPILLFFLENKLAFITILPTKDCHIDKTFLSELKQLSYSKFSIHEFYLIDENLNSYIQEKDFFKQFQILACLTQMEEKSDECQEIVFLQHSEIIKKTKQAMMNRNLFDDKILTFPIEIQKKIDPLSPQQIKYQKEDGIFKISTSESPFKSCILIQQENNRYFLVTNSQHTALIPYLTQNDTIIKPHELWNLTEHFKIFNCLLIQMVKKSKTRQSLKCLMQEFNDNFQFDFQKIVSYFEEVSNYFDQDNNFINPIKSKNSQSDKKKY